jgi:hypothetical protein
VTPRALRQSQPFDDRRDTMMTVPFLFALIALLPAPGLEAKSERAARVADTYQPAPPRVRYVGNPERCVTIHEPGKPDVRRCGL